MDNKSILTEAEVKEILRVAREMLLQFGQLAPMLFFQTLNGDKMVHSIGVLPDTNEQKRRLFFSLGLQLKADGKIVSEALFLAESWGVVGNLNESDLKIPPSRHPKRRELIMLFGRSASNATQVCALQHFGRDVHGKLFFEVPNIFVVDTHKDKEGLRAQGLLDDLFAAQAVGIGRA